MTNLEVDGEVLGHLLILQSRRGGSLSDQIQYLLDKVEPQLQLPLKKPRRQPRRYVKKADRCEGCGS